METLKALQQHWLKGRGGEEGNRKLPSEPLTELQMTQPVQEQTKRKAQPPACASEGGNKGGGAVAFQWSCGDVAREASTRFPGIVFSFAGKPARPQGRAASQGEGRGAACRKSLRRPRDPSGFAYRWRLSPGGGGGGGGSQLWVLMKRLAGAARNAFPVIAHPLYFHNGFIHFILCTYGILHGCNVPMKTAAGVRRLDRKPKRYFKSIV